MVVLAISRTAIKWLDEYQEPKAPLTRKDPWSLPFSIIPENPESEEFTCTIGQNRVVSSDQDSFYTVMKDGLYSRDAAHKGD
jgi:hypothetical protein